MKGVVEEDGVLYGDFKLTMAAVLLYSRDRRFEEGVWNVWSAKFEKCK